MPFGSNASFSSQNHLSPLLSIDEELNQTTMSNRVIQRSV